MLTLIGLAILLQLFTLAVAFYLTRQASQQQNHDIITQIKTDLIALKQQSDTLHQQVTQNHNLLQSNLRENNAQLSQQVQASLLQSTKHLQERFDHLNAATERHLLKISESVEQRLSKGFEKTTQTFTDIMKRLAIIDDAQKKISDLSQNVVSLQNVLADKRSRGAFGEVQLNTLIQNALPEQAYSMQHTLKNGLRADCILFLPQPTGNIVIDSKFPLENYQRFMDPDLAESDKTSAKQQFKQDIKKHIQDIAHKYIVPGETSDGAVMFIPAESIFAEIHAHHADLVELSQKSRVWLTSPSTMMAILTTACAVLKDSATREQVHIIQKHLHHLSGDFSRFEKRMDNLSKHIHKVHEDADLIHTSAKKITKRFTQIEQVDLGSLEHHTETVLISNNTSEEEVQDDQRRV